MADFVGHVALVHSQFSLFVQRYVFGEICFDLREADFELEEVIPLLALFPTFDIDLEMPVSGFHFRFGEIFSLWNRFENTAGPQDRFKYAHTSTCRLECTSGFVW